MNPNRKICVVTGTRAEYGLLLPILREIKKSLSLDLLLIASCMHYSKEFGETYKFIENDGFKINKKIEMLLSSDTKVGTSKSMGLGLIGFADAFDELKPDLVVILGDRFEALVAAQAAFTQGICIAHIHGGEVTLGAIDDGFRHAITKLSHYHFVSNEMHGKRVYQLGENPKNIFVTGAPGLDNIVLQDYDSKEEFEERIGIQIGDKKLILVTYHPETMFERDIYSDISSIIKSLDDIENSVLLFTKANADANGRIINQKIGEYVSNNKHKAVQHASLQQKGYLSALKYADLIVGNSSSGVIEAPYFKKPIINIGSRQEGRPLPKSVISTNISTFSNSICLALSEKWKSDHLNECENLYGIPGKISKNIVSILESTAYIFQKKFFDWVS